MDLPITFTYTHEAVSLHAGMYIQNSGDVQLLSMYLCRYVCTCRKNENSAF